VYGMLQVPCRGRSILRLDMRSVPSVPPRVAFHMTDPADHHFCRRCHRQCYCGEWPCVRCDDCEGERHVITSGQEVVKASWNASHGAQKEVSKEEPKS